MKDPRYIQLARVLIEHSCEVVKGDKVLIEAFDIPVDFTATLIEQVAKAGGVPLVSTYHEPIRRALQRAGSEEQLKVWAGIDLKRMEQMQCYIGVRGSHNTAEMSDVPREKIDLYEKMYLQPVHL